MSPSGSSFVPIPPFPELCTATQAPLPSHPESARELGTVSPPIPDTAIHSGDTRTLPLQQTPKPIQESSLCERPPFNAYDPERLSASVVALQASHADMCRRLQEMREELLFFRVTLQSEATPGIRERKSFELKAHERILMFARYNARILLKSTGSELGKHYRSICAANVVRQVLLRSKASDCTLLEFQIVAKFCLDNPSISCTVYPSEYYARFLSNSRATRFDIFFDTFLDYCEALRICIHDREAGFLRVRKKHGSNARTMQLLGVEIVSNSEDGRNERRVLPGRSISTSSTEVPIPVLHQISTSWSEGACENGFILRREEYEHLNQMIRSALPSENVRITDLDRVSMERRYFSLAWERSTPKVPDCNEIYPEHVAGTLRSFLPAVVVRSVLSTSSTDQIFKTRVNGCPLIQTLVSPAKDATAQHSSSR